MRAVRTEDRGMQVFRRVGERIGEMTGYGIGPYQVAAVVLGLSVAVGATATAVVISRRIR